MMLPAPRGKGTIRGSPFSSIWQSSLALSAGFWLIYAHCGKDAPCCPLQPHFHMLEIHQVTDFIFLGSKLTEDSDCSHEIKRRLLLERKAMPNLDSLLKSRDVTLPTKVHLVKAMAFPVGMYRCESWTIMKAECQRIDAFELWCWRRLLKAPWTARRFNQWLLKESVLNIHWKDCWSWSSNTLAT